MCQYVAIVVIAVLALAACIPPRRMTNDCRSEEEQSLEDLRYMPTSGEISRRSRQYDIHSFCDLIHRAIPEAVNNGKFLNVRNDDQDTYSDTVAPLAVSPPRGIIPSGFPKFRPSRLGTPKLDVPKLRPLTQGLKAPKIGPAMSFKSSRYYVEKESSAERMEKFKKGVQKMLHVVKVIGKIDQYLSERTRIVVDKLTKTFSD